MGLLLNIYLVSLVFVCLLVCTIVQFFVLLVTAPFDRTRFYCGRTFRSLGFIIAKLSGVWDFGVEGRVPPLPDRAVVVSNHDSNLDTLLISHLPWEMKWLSKANLARIPLLGWCMSMAGDIFIKRGDSKSSQAALAECAAWIERGAPVFIFPEGTRRRNSELGPFRSGAFRLAIDTQSHIVPLAISGTWGALAPRTAHPQRARARVMVGEPISTEGMTLDDVESLKQRTRASIESMAKQLRPLTTQDDGSDGSDMAKIKSG